ncbi:ZINC KNUCKLE CX2CX4HX4C-RELATED [Salix viminalis]|uniref:ZINC KNUCKLE CX2CX4HX4C-RELATED n=1 Tax=Salix viminalis TaxID=40686 RepID=A0A9Q0NNG5_SALVM|nr:ZINC KNUCKLE CX2CX4HX4C-RELATED [Salix viminalis]
MAAIRGKSQNKNTLASQKAQTSSRADRVKVTDSSTRFTLEPVQRSEDGRQPEITMDMLTDNAEQWNRCIVGFFPGYRMNYHTVTTVANRVWKTEGLESVMSTANGFWLFRFQTEDQMQAILERGPWMFGGKAIILQQWHPEFVFDKNRISKLPVWVRLHGLPFSLWSRKGLSVAASMVGRPLSCDEATFCCSRLDYARVCVEVDAAKPFTHNFEINTPFSEQPLHIEVEYEWKPSRCPSCKLFGHACKPQEEKKADVAATTAPSASTKATAHSTSTMGLATKETTVGQTKQGALGKVDQGPQTLPTGDNGDEESQKNTHTKEAPTRAAKGKAKIDALPECTVNEATSLLSTSHSVQEDEENNAANDSTECSTTSRDTPPMAFTKVRKKKGGKKNKEAHCL